MLGEGDKKYVVVSEDDWEEAMSDIEVAENLVAFLMAKLEEYGEEYDDIQLEFSDAYKARETN